jgi:hypothetical protein
MPTGGPFGLDALRITQAVPRYNRFHVFTVGRGGRWIAMPSKDGDWDACHTCSKGDRLNLTQALSGDGSSQADKP